MKSEGSDLMIFLQKIKKFLRTWWPLLILIIVFGSVSIYCYHGYRISKEHEGYCSTMVPVSTLTGYEKLVDRFKNLPSASLSREIPDYVAREDGFEPVSVQEVYLFYQGKKLSNVCYVTPSSWTREYADYLAVFLVSSGNELALVYDSVGSCGIDPDGNIVRLQNYSVSQHDNAVECTPEYLDEHFSELSFGNCEPYDFISE